MPNTRTETEAYSAIRSALAKCRGQTDPVNWLFTAISDLPLSPDSVRRLAQLLDRYSDQLERERDA